MSADPGSRLFGRLPDHREVACYLLSAPRAGGGIRLEVLELGATVHRLWVPGPDGRSRNVVLGHPTLEGYLSSPGYLGAVVGRFANRIAGGRFPLGGRSVVVARNEGPNTLHGGPEGFDRRLWSVLAATGSSLTLSLVSPDGDQGFPGRLEASVTYEVGAGEVRLRYAATTTAPTVVNLTNHAYVNLDGEGSGSVDGHLLSVQADAYTPVGPDLIPTGEHAAVDGTPFDWRTPALVGPRLAADDEQLRRAGGLDHNFVIRGAGLREHASALSPASGIHLTVLSDQPGVQVYTGNQLDGSIVGTSGRRYGRRAGLALETQHFPDSPNQPSFPSTTLLPGEVLQTTTVWRFGALSP